MFTTGAKKWRAALAAAGLAGAVLLAACQTPQAPPKPVAKMPAMVKLDRIDLRLPVFLADPPADVIGLYTVERGRIIVDGPRPAPGDSIDVSDLLTNAEIHRAFMAVAFGGGEMDGSAFGLERGPGERRYTGDTLVKLPPDVEVAMLGFARPIPFEAQQMMADAQRQISAETGVRFHAVEERNPGRFTLVHFFPEDRAHAAEIAESFRRQAALAEGSRARGWRNLAHIMDTFAASDVNCTAFPSFSEDRRPSSILIVIKTGPGNRVDCLYEELVQSMGLFRDDDSLVGTLFTNSFKYYRRPTRLDWLMLKVLYDQRLQHGMTRAEAGPVVQRILAELRPHGEAPGVPG